MCASVANQLSRFAVDVAEGLSHAQKRIPASYFYDELGSALFEAITLLPEYGLTRADERLLSRYAAAIARQTGPISLVAELGSGSGKKTRHILEAARKPNATLVYHPIDVSRAALEACGRELGDISDVRPICGDWTEGLSELSRRRGDERLLLMFLGSSIGNLDRDCVVEFLRTVRFHLRRNDFFLLGADLVKNVALMLTAYNDPTGVTAAFNLNLLARVNRELDANFDLRSFAHEVRWSQEARRIEMHLLCCADQVVRVGALDTEFQFCAGETIWTESSHKFTKRELADYASAARFDSLATWTDAEWPFAETLWQAV